MKLNLIHFLSKIYPGKPQVVWIINGTRSALNPVTENEDLADDSLYDSQLSGRFMFLGGNLGNLRYY